MISLNATLGPSYTTTIFNSMLKSIIISMKTVAKHTDGCCYESVSSPQGVNDSRWGETGTGQGHPIMTPGCCSIVPPSTDDRGPETTKMPWLITPF